MLKIKLNPFAHLPGVASREVVGIELGTNNLKIMKLGVSLNTAEVQGVWSRNISGLSDEDISKVVRAALAELKFRYAGVFNIIPSHLVITKNIEIPSTNPKEINDIINLQAGRHTPFSREEIIVDYVEIGVYKNNYTKILLVIAARHVIKRQVDILEKAGLRLENSFLSAEGIAAACPKALRIETQNAPISIVHMDEGFSDFILVFRNKPIFIRSISIGISHLSEAKEVYEAKFIEELKRSLEAYQNEDIDKIPHALVLTGAIDQIKDLENTLSSLMHLPVKSVPYLRSLAVAEGAVKGMNAARRVSFFDLIACLTSADKLKINLVPEEIKLRKAFEERGRDLIKSGIFVLTIFVLTFSIFLTKIYFKGAYLKKLDKKYQALDKDARDLEGNFNKVGAVKSYLSSRGYSLEVLTELYNIVTDDLLLTDIRFDEQGKFSIKGTAEAMSSVFAFVEKMEKSGYFKDAKTRYTTKRKEGLKDVTDFEIVSALVK